MRHCLITLFSLGLAIPVFAAEGGYNQRVTQVNGVGAIGNTGAKTNFIGDGITRSYNNPAGANNDVTAVDFSDLQTTQGNTNASNISTVQGQVSTVQTDVSGLQTSVSDLNSTVSSVSTGLADETNNRISADTNLQTQVNSLNTELSSVGGGSGLSNALKTEAQERKKTDAALQQGIDGNTSRVDSLEKQVHEQGEAKVLMEGAVRLYDGKHVQFQAFNAYDARHGRNFAVGARIILKVGSSYEERQIAQQRAKLEAQQAHIETLTRAVVELGHRINTSYVSDKLVVPVQE